MPWNSGAERDFYVKLRSVGRFLPPLSNAVQVPILVVEKSF
jgi:hypothetical protein